MMDNELMQKKGSGMLIGLQYFAEPSESSEQQQEQQQSESATISYTQEQLNSMMAREKRTARQALMKELGFEVTDDKSYQENVKRIKATLDAGKTQQQLDQEARTAAEQNLSQAEARASAAEAQLAALKAGVNPDFLEDAILLATAKVTAEVDLSTAIEGLKTKHPSFFNGYTGSQGTGGSTNPKRRSYNGTDGLGKRLASEYKPTTKNPYFHN